MITLIIIFVSFGVITASDAGKTESIPFYEQITSDFNRRSLKFFSLNHAASASNVFLKHNTFLDWWKRNENCYLKDNLIILMITFSIKMLKLYGAVHIWHHHFQGAGRDHKLMIHNQTTLITWGRVGGGQNLGIKSWWSNIWMAPMCLLSGIYVRFMS